MKRLLLFLILIVFSGAVCNGQGNLNKKSGIKGAVSIYSTREAVTGATVKFFDGSIKKAEVFTDTEGNYSAELPLGLYEMNVVYFGRSHEVSRLKVLTGKFTTANFKISLMEEGTISTTVGSMHPLVNDNFDVNIEELNEEEMKAKYQSFDKNKD